MDWRESLCSYLCSTKFSILKAFLLPVFNSFVISVIRNNRLWFRSYKWYFREIKNPLTGLRFMAKIHTWLCNWSNIMTGVHTLLKLTILQLQLFKRDWLMRSWLRKQYHYSIQSKSWTTKNWMFLHRFSDNCNFFSLLCGNVFIPGHKLSCYIPWKEHVTFESILHPF